MLLQLQSQDKKSGKVIIDRKHSMSSVCQEDKIMIDLHEDEE